ncbi:MAG: hypothetical protein H7145_12665 [Akkermansiaceae bacterium]|nr:hypothetical protein [Armatimonadota bacterium]
MGNEKTGAEAEHEFFRDWKKRLESRLPLLREELELLVSHREWAYSTTDIINDACRFRLVTVDDAVWLQRQFDAESYVHKQLETFVRLNDPQSNWKEVFLLALANRTNWAAREILTDLGASDIEDARAMIESSSRPKSVKNELLGIVQDVAKRTKPRS